MKSCNKILVSGLLSKKVTLNIPKLLDNVEFINSCPCTVNEAFSGEALNISRALNVLGDDVNLISIVGKDLYGDIILKELRKYGINSDFVHQLLEDTAQEIVMVDEYKEKKRYFDFKELEKNSYDNDIFCKAMNECSIIFLCDDDLSNDFFNIVNDYQKVLATSVENLESVQLSRKRFIHNANILFSSSKCLDEEIESSIKRIADDYGNDIILVSLDDGGAMLYVRKDNFIGKYPFVKTRKIINTDGREKALYASFLHCYNKTLDPYISTKKSLCFESYKLGGKGEMDGFITEEQLDKLYNFLYN
ncbi:MULTISPECIES: carbohydrate kinase family protein [Clostridium]|uniref:Carbohydrate kinase PfkB domain-containing protein n=1 Tax=Clostridium cibarium TaxID=2762247 RepID=A0ABR8PYL9_9CLOT|nr:MULTISPECIES: carbohydrate kinase family protein [Clostridium]MBD7913209.1 hypothetical protein [Clostridium cibarium]